MTRRSSRSKITKAEAEAWDFKFPVDPNFRWITQTGEVVHPSEMSTWHLFNCLRMIWNHTVQPQYRLYPYNRYKEIRWPRQQIHNALQNLLHELLNRHDRVKRMETELEYMRETVTRHGKKMLEQ